MQNAGTVSILLPFVCILCVLEIRAKVSANRGSFSLPSSIPLKRIFLDFVLKYHAFQEVWVFIDIGEQGTCRYQLVGQFFICNHFPIFFILRRERVHGAAFIFRKMMVTVWPVGAYGVFTHFPIPNLSVPSKVSLLRSFV